MEEQREKENLQHKIENFSKIPRRNSRVIVEFHFHAINRKLPYISISNSPFKLLINIGVAKSFFTLKTTIKFNPDNVKRELFIVTSIFQNHSQDYCAKIPIFPEFNTDGNFKFYIFKFYKTFHGLQTLDNLKFRKAYVNLPESKIITENSTISILYYESNKNYVMLWITFLKDVKEKYASYTWTI